MPRQPKNKLVPLEQYQQFLHNVRDLNDYWQWTSGEYYREDCGHLCRKGYVCLCGKDHDEERALRKQAEKVFLTD